MKTQPVQALRMIAALFLVDICSGSTVVLRDPRSMDLSNQANVLAAIRAMDPAPQAMIRAVDFVTGHLEGLIAGASAVVIAIAVVQYQRGERVGLRVPKTRRRRALGQIYKKLRAKHALGTEQKRQLW